MSPSDVIGLSVSLPRAAFDRRLSPDEVSIRGEQPINGAETLPILVKKDFACLAQREGEDEAELFPNPAQHTS